MNESDTTFETTVSCESNDELNGKDASYRNAPMISTPRLITKQRIRGALVPMRKTL